MPKYRVSHFARRICMSITRSPQTPKKSTNCLAGAQAAGWFAPASPSPALPIDLDAAVFHPFLGQQRCRNVGARQSRGIGKNCDSEISMIQILAVRLRAAFHHQRRT
jgi:hypothetical protein